MALPAPKGFAVSIAAGRQLEGVSVALGGRLLLGPISATVDPGGCLTVMGPSGCGKSTLLAFLAGTLDPVFTARGRIGIGAFDLTLLPPEQRHMGFAHRDPATLSGGQRARVAVMRTLSAEPHALLLDEPFSKLDVQLRGDFRRFVFGHARKMGLPTVLVTHDEADAQAAGGPVVRFDAK